MKWRYRLSLFVFLGLFFLIITRLFYWQVVKAEELSAMGASQYGKQIVISPERGEIRTSDGFPIASNKISYLLYANPKEISEVDKEKISIILSEKLSLDPASVSAQLRQDLFWVPIEKNIDVSVKDELEKLTLTGVGFEEQYVRFYPEASMAAQLIGFVGKNDTGEDKGYFGIEGYYDRQLRGKGGVAIQIDDAVGRPILAKMNNDSGRINGRNLTLTVDRAIQFLVERKLKKGIENFGAVSGMVIIMDPKTGSILSMASFPSFDPRSYRDYDVNTYKNPLITNLYEPGSTFKALIMAAGIDSKVVKPDTKCPICASPLSIGGYEVRTWNNQYKKDIDMTEVIIHSDNTGMVYVSQQLGIDRMLDYLKKFGIGDLTGVDLQGEVSVGLRPSKNWYPIDVATLSFGQGISVTPIELLSAFSSLANGGKRMEPHIVKEIQTPEGQIITIPPKLVGQPVSEATAKVMTEILVNAVDKGEAQFAKIKGYRVAGKTGTAQIPIAGHYDPTKTIASFIGFAPAQDPKFAMLVVIDRPTSSIYGAETAAPVFFDIARDLFAHYGIAPSQ